MQKPRRPLPSQTQPPQFTVRVCAEPLIGATPKAPLKAVPRSPRQPCPCKPRKPSQWQPFSRTLGQNICPQSSPQKPWKPLGTQLSLITQACSWIRIRCPFVHHSLKPGQRIRWIPWQLRLSQKQYQEAMEAKATKPLRTEAQLLSPALFDDTPEMTLQQGAVQPG